MKTIRVLLGAALSAAALASPLLHAQPFPAPNKPIRIVVPTAPAGGNDAMARIVAQRLGERLKTAVIVENKAGANGSIGSESVAKSAPDGYTILLGYIATHGINPGLSKVSYDPVKDFVPIIQIAEAQGILVVNPSVPARNVKELIAVAKAKKGELTYASAGNGTAPHISGELFKQLAGIDMLHVPYKGSAPAVTDTLAGHAQVMFPSLVAAGQHVKSGKLRGLAVTGKKRSPLFPDLPTIAEAGVPGFEITQWYGFFAPARTPKEVVDRLSTEIAAIMKEPDTVKRFADQGADVVVRPGAEFGRYVESELGKWGNFIKVAKITAD